MTVHRSLPSAIARSAFALVLLVAAAAPAPVPPDLLSGLVWRNVGPFRGGRISAASGAIGEPGTFYVGLPGGGIWKTTSAGEIWFPVFDAVSAVSSIGAVAVAPSDPKIVYAGTGDQWTQGITSPANGVYKSTDAGAHWQHLGLDSATLITSILVDPRDPKVVLVGVLGDLRLKGGVRGVFRSTDGGATWTRTLFVSDTVGVSEIASAYDRPDIIFATTRKAYDAPPPASGVAPPFTPPPPGTLPVGGVFKSTDGGATWKQLTGGNIPQFSRRVSIAVAMTTNAQRVYLTTNLELHRSDDGGVTWKQMDPTDTRVRNGQGGYNSGVLVDPKDPDVVYTFNTSSYKSVDGGNSFTGFKGAPGGDDPQRGWIDPTNGQRMLLGYDQGAIVTFDGGASWSSWYNQSTEQVYHVTTDHSFPYWVYATQQDAGAVRTRSRGDVGMITPHDWSPVNGWEWGTVAPDPSDANIVYVSGYGLNKIQMASGQWNNVSPWLNTDLRVRSTISQPIAWAPWDSKELLAGFQRVFATTDGGAHWRALSGDLTYPAGVTPPPDTATPAPNGPRRGAIEWLSPSPVAKGMIWVATSNGLIKLTRDHGKTWSDVSIAELPFRAAADIEKIDASPFDAAVAYASVDLSNAGDIASYVYRTRDAGKSWQLITNGLRDGAPGASIIHAVRADLKRPGLLFAASERGMYVSFDDGDRWQSLQLNLPNTSFKDITFAGNDLVVGTYGRGIWILDDYAVLRQMTPEIAQEPVHLFAPDPAVRVRRSTNYNTPLPPEAPHALNPPDGAIVYYWLAAAPQGEVTIEVLDASSAVVRHLSSTAAPPVKEAAKPPFNDLWLAPPERVPAHAGLNRANWDIRTDAPATLLHTFEINATPGGTPASPVGILAPPGTYTIRLTVNGTSYSRAVTVSNDPRSAASAADLQAQVAFQRKIVRAIRATNDGFEQVEAMRARLDSLTPADSALPLTKAIQRFAARLDSVGGTTVDERPFDFPSGQKPATDLYSLQIRIVDQFQAQETGDLAPTEPARQGFAISCRELANTLANWQALNGQPLAALNAEVTKAGKPPLAPAKGVPAPAC